MSALVAGEMVRAAYTAKPIGTPRPEGGPKHGQDSEVTYPNPDYQAQIKRVRRMVRSFRPPAPEPQPDPVSWGADHVRVRMVEAAQTLRRLPTAATDRPSSKAAGGLGAIHGWGGYGYSAPVVRVQPTTEEITRLEECLVWLRSWLDTDHQMAVWGVAMGVPLRKIAQQMTKRRHRDNKKGVSYETVRRYERSGVERIARRLDQKKARDKSAVL